MMDKISTEDWIEYKSNATKILRRNNQDETSNAVQIAIDKQIPQKPYRISGIDTNDNAMVDCPICKAGNDTSIKTIRHIYCWKCGQALQWE